MRMRETRQYYLMVVEDRAARTCVAIGALILEAASPAGAARRARIEDIFVAEQVRARRFDAVLVEHALALAHLLGAREVTLQCAEHVAPRLQHTGLQADDSDTHCMHVRFDDPFNCSGMTVRIVFEKSIRDPFQHSNICILGMFLATSTS